MLSLQTQGHDVVEDGCDTVHVLVVLQSMDDALQTTNVTLAFILPSVDVKFL